MKYVMLSLIAYLPLLANTRPYCIGEFELLNKMMVVEAKVEAVEGYFIIDTGAPNLILNQTYFEGEKSDWVARGVGSTAKAQKRLVKSFEWGCVTKKNFTVFVVNLEYLERAIGKPFLGLIGYELLKQKELLFDYENQRIEQHKLKKSDLHLMDDPNQSISFRLAAHVPILEIELDEQAMNFILDTASEDNLLQKTEKATQYPVKNMKLLVGTDQRPSLARVVVIPNTALTDMALEDQEYLLTTLSNTSAEGILGFPVLNELSKFSINYRKRKIYIWD
ncbi:MAG: hypothetical protein AAF849_12430 [Bacteroidota bacterium]